MKRILEYQAKASEASHGWVSESSVDYAGELFEVKGHCECETRFKSVSVWKIQICFQVQGVREGQEDGDKVSMDILVNAGDKNQAGCVIGAYMIFSIRVIDMLKAPAYWILALVVPE